MRFCYLLSLVLVAAGLKAEPTTITWLYFNFPPYHIVDGDRKGEGIVDPMFSLVRQTLTEYDHYFLPVSISRAINFMEHPQEHTCLLSGFVDPVYSSAWALSQPIFHEIPPLLAMKSRTAELLPIGDSIELVSLVRDFPKMIFGRTADQMIGRSVTDFLTTYEGKNVAVLSSAQSLDSLHKMLAHDRVNYIVAYGAEIGWMKQTVFTNEYETLQLFPITEVNQVFNPVYVTCPRSGDGEKMIAQLNEALTDTVRANIWVRYLEWLPDARSKAFFLAHQQLEVKANTED